LATSLNPSTVGASVTFTASVTGVGPTGNVAFKDGASNICAAVTLVGTGNTRTATCTTGALSQATHSITAVYAGDAGNATSTSSALSQVVNAATAGASTNVALASNGGVPTVSSSYGAGYLASSLNNNERAGMGWGSGGGWNSGAPTVAAMGAGHVQRRQDDRQGRLLLGAGQLRQARSSRYDSTTFSLWGVVNFNVQAWNGTSWYTVASVAGQQPGQAHRGFQRRDDGPYPGQHLRHVRRLVAPDRGRGLGAPGARRRRRRELRWRVRPIRRSSARTSRSPRTSRACCPRVPCRSRMGPVTSVRR
jgi:hypothetical protein